jgi:hypothetical protein
MKIAVCPVSLRLLELLLPTGSRIVSVQED